MLFNCPKFCEKMRRYAPRSAILTIDLSGSSLPAYGSGLPCHKAVDEWQTSWSEAKSAMCGAVAARPEGLDTALTANCVSKAYGYHAVGDNIQSSTSEMLAATCYEMAASFATLKLSPAVVTLAKSASAFGHPSKLAGNTIYIWTMLRGAVSIRIYSTCNAVT